MQSSDFSLLGRILNRPDRIEDAGITNLGRPGVRFIKRIGNETYVVVLELRGAKRRMAAVQSMWIRKASGDPSA